MFSITPMMTNGLLEEDPFHGLHARQILILWIFTCGVAWNSVYAAPVDN
jgi:hypothetical protein